MSGPFTDRQRRELAGRARTFHERRDGPANVPETDPPIAPERVVEAWREQFLDEAAFHARLEYEGLTTDDIREATRATHWPPDEPLPDWVSSVEALAEYFETVAPDGDLDVDLPEETPFRPIHEAIAAYARDRLPADDVPVDATSPLLDGLVDRLMVLLSRALYVEFKSFVEYHDEELAHADPEAFDDPPTTYYRSFVDSMFGHGFANLCLEYPVLARQLVLSIAFWTDAVTETCRRIEADRPALGETFGVAGEVTELQPLADDVHGQGRFPVRVSFEGGDVVYKPRPVDAGAAFYAVLDRLEEYLSTPPVRKPRYLSRDGYGWMEPVETDELPDADAAHRYYRRAGVLACLAYVLNFTDCQYENVIATDEQPTIVDGETLFHPYADLDEGQGMHQARTMIHTTPLLTYLLPYDIDHSGELDEETFDPSAISGFGTASGPTELPDTTGPSFTAVNTDLMTVVGEPLTITTDANTPTLDGRDCPPGEHLDAMIDAFEETHETIQSLHDDGEFFASIADPDLVSGVENRFLYRTTRKYDAILRSSRAREPLRDGVRLSAEFEELSARLFGTGSDAERWWPLVPAERASLLRRDVPRLTSYTDERTLYHDGEPLDAAVDSPGIERAREHAERLDAADRSQQASLLAQAFEPLRPPDAAPPAVTATDDRLRRVAVDLFEGVLDATVEPLDTKEWVSPYSTGPIRFVPAATPLNYGKCGIALAAAALYDATGRDRYRRLVDELLGDVADALRADRDDVRLAGVNGVGSVVYTLAVVTDLLDDGTYRRQARAAARRVSPDRFDDSVAVDVMTGLAGELSGLLAYHERYGDREVLDSAVDCGEWLLDARVTHDGYEVWETFDGPATGFAHGQSGIAYSLARLSVATGERRYATAARQAFDFESDRVGTVDRERAHRGGVDKVPAWCRGRAGRALARIETGRLLGDDAMMSTARQSLEAVERADPHPFDNVCCGNLGRADVLVAGARRLDADVAVPAEPASRCLTRLDRDGGLALPGHSGAFPNVSFFDGLSGAAYTLLRQRDPEALPCVLLLE